MRIAPSPCFDAIAARTFSAIFFAKKSFFLLEVPSFPHTWSKTYRLEITDRYVGPPTSPGAGAVK